MTQPGFKRNSTAVKDDCVREGTDGTGADDDDDDDKDIPSNPGILSRTKRKEAVARTDLSPECTTTEQLIDDGSPEDDRADAGAGASGVRPGDSQDRLIELDDDEPDNHKLHGVTSDDGGRDLDATRTGGQRGSSPYLSDRLTEIMVGDPSVYSAPTDGVNGH